MHVALAAVAGLVRTAWGRIAAPSRRAWAGPLALGVLGFLVLFPFDGVISKALETHQPGGDVRKELLALQQYGQFTVSVVVAGVIWLLDPARRRRLMDWLAAAIVAIVAVNLVKVLSGRPRPKFDDPALFLGPFGAYPVRTDSGEGIRHSWEVWGRISSDLWSMPSSHTAYACVMSVMLTAMYPKLRVVAVVLAAVVALCRVWFDAHYPTDVVVGAAIGVAAARLAFEREWGQRAWARLSARSAAGPGRA